ncbi:MAG: NGG1p interacting factor NIF3 [Candidatus Omnitrophica bacterium]|nr:NGG1p interacting factor NIF3 [Candidatus Omnitrophota bacterium]
MKLAYLYNQAVKFGIERDPRSKKSALHSYADTAILFGRPDTEVKKVLVGIDIDVGELLLADKIRQEQGIDLVLSHHPQGRAWAGLYQVMSLQIDLLLKVGIEKKLAQELLEERMNEVERKLMPHNHLRTQDAARLLNLPFMCLHTPADNHAAYFIHRLLKKERPKKIKDILEILTEIPEYKQAQKEAIGPRLILGSSKRPVGKIFVEMTGGTEGPKDIYNKFSQLGIRTLISMHLSEEHFKKVKDANLNVVIAGHISSDTLGLNLLLDRIEKKANERLETIDCAGFRRIRH